MPADMPYPGESDEQFLARMMAQMQGGPGTPMPAPDPRLLAMQQMTGQAPGTVPVEEMMTNDPSFGGDASMADAYGGPDPYTAGLPGATGPRTPMQNRNRRVALSEPDETDDEFEQREMVGDYEATNGSMDRIGPDGDGPSTEDELDMVQRQITKTGHDQSSERDFDSEADEYGFTGDSEEDAQYIRGLIDAGEDVGDLVERFKEFYGFDLDGQSDED